MHSKSIVHNDITADYNVIIAKAVVKFIDFGKATLSSNPTQHDKKRNQNETETMDN